jgi:hypothetical protein
VKDNCFKAREFKDIDEAKAFLMEWLETIANVRIHGTTKKVPSEEFNSYEKEKLLPLPTEEYNISEIASATVMPNCHISYGGNYYSVPYAYIGEKVDIVIIDNLLKAIYKDKEIALHPLEKNEKGKFFTDKNHYPDYKNITANEIKSRYREKMGEIGKHAAIFFEKFLEQVDSKYNYRAIAGIISLRKKYDNATIDNACHRAYMYNALKYKTVKRICEQGIDSLPIETNQTYINSEETFLSRPLSEYSKLLN